MIEVHRPVSRARQKDVSPAIREAHTIDRSLVVLIGLEVLLVIRDGTSEEIAILCAGDVGRGICRTEIKA